MTTPTPESHFTIGRELLRFLDDYIEGRPVSIRQAIKLSCRLETAIQEAEAIEAAARAEP